MARLLSQTLIRVSVHPFDRAFAPSYRLTSVRNRSKRPEVHLIEIDLGSDGTASSASGTDDEKEGGVMMGIKHLEEVIHRIAVHRAAPYWLPFRPGSSYWVPPPPPTTTTTQRSSIGVIELFRKLANPLSEEETLSLTSARGWPSSAYFIEGQSTPVPKDDEEG
ncbi:hypothetical protein QJS04_geneDACA013959 [Acorus gramineus]|uniref:Uncharacterized protein n=1 Tax=Acorus gramineus TaxID=55184 RepID=A0AAV9AWB1_ACOGR|nr:hypothetical protein QJS04_geneDACA013959 [Acorus gramineus]